MKKFNNIEYKEFSTEDGKNYCVSVRVKVNPYLVDVFRHLLYSENRKVVLGAYPKREGIIEFDITDIRLAKDACDKVFKLADIKYEFVSIED